MPIDYDVIAKQYGFSREAVQHLATALARGNGQQAQFNHPELGGMGQWQAGMIMIGDMFNHTLKARVESLCIALANQTDLQDVAAPIVTQKAWWPDDLGSPTMSGSQNEAKYAYFHAAQRLAIMRSGQLKLYSTDDNIITGVSQQQNSTIQALVFQTTKGTISEADLETFTT